MRLTLLFLATAAAGASACFWSNDDSDEDTKDVGQSTTTHKTTTTHHVGSEFLMRRSADTERPVPLYHSLKYAVADDGRLWPSQVREGEQRRYRRAFSKRSDASVSSERFSKPRVNIVQAPAELLQAGEHGKTILECSANGVPAPRLRWLKNGEPIEKIPEYPLIGQGDADTESVSTTTSRLNLHCMGEDDAGIYECVADNLQGLTDSVATRLQVSSFSSTGCTPGDDSDLALSAPEIVEYMKTYLNQLGTVGHLFCRANGADSISWLDNNSKPIPADSDEYKFLENGDLVIPSLTFDKMGVFTCVATNEHGQDTKQTFVYPFAPS